MKIPNNIKEYRLRKGLTLIQAAKLIKLDCADRLSKWEHGHKYPSVPNLFRLCAAYEALPEELYPIQSMEPFSLHQDICPQEGQQIPQVTNPPQP
jgi:transcriptional regulator with XRE-family HTH domain